MNDNSQKRLDRLARIRENQRKSRAKKQEYIQELEQKLAVCQDEARQKDIEHRLMVQKLQAENRKLRQLCSRPEQESIFAEEYRTADAPVEARKVAIPAIRRDDSALPVAECTRGSQDPDDMEQAASAGMLQLADTAAPESYESQENQSVCGCSPNDGDSWPADEDVLNTTLCAIADELINQYNSRGVDMVDIRRKLWDGFRKGLGSGEGCRVQNQILFQVLDEISND